MSIEMVFTNTMARRILIVEDDTTLANLIASVLEDAGFESRITASPDTVEGTYDLVVSDYMAPAFVPDQPWPFLDRLRDLSRGPILGCTGHQGALAHPPSSLGITAITAKPFDLDDLVKQVEELIEQGERVSRESPVRPTGDPSGSSPCSTFFCATQAAG